MSWSLVIHGGAGTLKVGRDVSAHRAALTRALELGRARLTDGQGALDVVCDVVALLEDAPEFNAGRGSVFTADGDHALDAAVMTPSGAGAVCETRTVKNPVRLARAVLERSAHVLLSGAGAERFCDTVELERVNNDWFDTAARRAQFERHAGKLVDAEKHGTVGAVACDTSGALAAATSTGGLTGKQFGRIGDSPIPGAGVFCDTRVALSGTGIGERFIEGVLLAKVAHRVELLGEPLSAAMRAVVDETAEGTGGIIGVDREGRAALCFNTLGMYRGEVNSDGTFSVNVFKED